MNFTKKSWLRRGIMKANTLDKLMKIQARLIHVCLSCLWCSSSPLWVFFFHYMIFLLSIIIIIKPRVLNGFLSFSLLSPILVSLALWNRFWKRQRRVGWLQMYVGFFFCFCCIFVLWWASLNFFFVIKGLVYRYDVSKSSDGVAGEEGTFCMCTLWYVPPPFFFFLFFFPSFSPKKHTVH